MRFHLMRTSLPATIMSVLSRRQVSVLLFFAFLKICSGSFFFFLLLSMFEHPRYALVYPFCYPLKIEF